MQVLALNRRILLAFGLCIKDSNNPHYGRFINYGIFVILACFLMITTEYISSHFDDRTDAIYALMQFVSFLSAWACYPCFANQKCQTFKVLNNIQEIANDYRKCFGLRTINKYIWIYFRSNKKIEKMNDMEFMEKPKKNHIRLRSGQLYFICAHFMGPLLKPSLVLSYLIWYQVKCTLKRGIQNTKWGKLHKAWHWTTIKLWKISWTFPIFQCSIWSRNFVWIFNVSHSGGLFCHLLLCWIFSLFLIFRWNILLFGSLLRWIIGTI